ARQYGLLGNNIFDTDFNFDIKILEVRVLSSAVKNLINCFY
ncbi:unnamed protein product, partial [marine sediment metagenome]